MRPLPAVPAARLGVVTVGEARRAGWSPDALERAARSGRLVRVRRGVYAEPPGADLHPAVRDRLVLGRVAVAAALTLPDVVVSHLAAATIHGWPTWAVTPRPCVTAPGRTAGRMAGVHLHRSAGAGVDVGRNGGVPVTGPVRTVVDLAAEFGVPAALVAADAAAGAGVLGGDDLLRAAAGSTGRVRERLLTVAALVDPLAESPLESRSRWELRCHGVPVPATQVDLRDLSGRFLGRGDFYWAAGVVGEVDGGVKYADPESLRREKWRQERLEATGLRVVRWGAGDLADFAPVAARLRRALAAAATRTEAAGWVATPGMRRRGGVLH